MVDFDQKLKNVNAGLKAAFIGLAIEKRRSKLCLRGIFPPSPNSKKTKPFQQRLHLGIPANDQGLKAAAAKAREISSQLLFNQFAWEDYLSTPNTTTSILIGDAIALFENYYFSQRERNEKSLLTWREDYLKPFRKLPSSQPLTTEILAATILESKPDSRQRKRLAMAYAALADKFHLDHNLRELKGSYSPNAVNPRNLPDEDVIARWGQGDLIRNPQWLWVYRMIACYGLRNHEVFFIDFSNYPICFVQKGKTNERYCYPLYPEWAEKWKLNEGNSPQCSGELNSDYGSRVTHAFYRYNVPFNPYDMRHCWARRAFEFSLDPGLAARSMGHSLAVHCNTYRHWIDENIYRQVYQKMIDQVDRPKPPSHV